MGRHGSMRDAAAIMILTAGVLAGCSSPMSHYAGNDPAMAYVPVAQAGITDARPAFRALFCQVLERSPTASSQACDFWLLRRSDEAPATAVQKAAPPSHHHYQILIVTGVFAECLPSVPAFADATARLQELGFTVSYAPVKGRASADWNADIIRDHIKQALATDASRKFLVLAYSKGAVDTLTALQRYPALASAIAGVISFAGAVNGSPLADYYQDFYQRVAANLPMADCPVTDGGELTSLKREHRLNWLATHMTITGPRYFSIVATPTPERVSTVFQPMHTALSHIDPRNDGQVLHHDAILPGATLLGYVNADHFAIALPFLQRLPTLAKTFIDMNDFPRSQLIEAAVLFAEQTLASNLNESNRNK